MTYYAGVRAGFDRGDCVQGGDHVLGDHLIPATFFNRLGSQKDCVTDEQSIGPAHAGVFTLITAGDHNPGSDLHLAQNIPTAFIVFDFVVIDQLIRILGKVHAALFIQHA